MQRPLVINIIVGVVGILLGATIMYFVRGSGGGPAASANQALRLDFVNVGTLPPQGSADAKVAIVEFGDFECPFCKRWHDETHPKLMEKYGDQVVLYFRHYPLSSIHPDAMDAAVAAECANDQGKFWEMHDALYAADGLIDLRARQDMAESIGLDMTSFNSCVATDPFQHNIDADVLDGVSYGVAGTPTFFVNGVRMVGALPFERFVTVIDQELAK